MTPVKPQISKFKAEKSCQAGLKCYGGTAHALPSPKVGVRGCYSRENFWISHYRMRVFAHFEGRNVVSG
jgi:hypothetical protein